MAQPPRPANMLKDKGCNSLQWMTLQVVKKCCRVTRKLPFTEIKLSIKSHSVEWGVKKSLLIQTVVFQRKQDL